MYDKRYIRTMDPERVQLESDGEDSMGIYPHPTVRVVRPGHNSWKEALTEIARRKTFLAAMAAVIAVILLIVVIVISAGGEETNEDKSSHYTTVNSAVYSHKYGLLSYPVPTNGIIRFKPDDPHTYKAWMEQLQDVLYSYSPGALTPTEKYTHCDLHQKTAGNYCFFNIYDVGTACHTKHDYGYSEGRPCVLLQLKLNYIPGTVEKNSSSWKRLNENLGRRFMPGYIGVTCKGQTQEDQKNLEKDQDEIHPVLFKPEAFKSTFFPTDAQDDKDLAPIVMVRFSALNNHVPVKIRCVAWTQTKEGILPKSEELFSTEFSILIE